MIWLLLISGLATFFYFRRTMAEVDADLYRADSAYWERLYFQELSKRRKKTRR